MIELDRVRLSAGAFSTDIASLSVPLGGATVVVGPNGAGKTTLLEAIVGLRTLEHGRIRIEGLDARVWMRDLRRRRTLGVQLQTLQYPDKSRVGEILGLHAVAYRRAARPEVRRAFEVDALASTYYERLSRGEKQRVDLYIALAHDPRLVLLDEPTTGLDADTLGRTLALLRVLAEDPAVTLLYASHLPRERALARSTFVLERDVVLPGAPA